MSERYDDDTRSVASTFSRVSVNPTAHAQRRQGGRNITDDKIKAAKRGGTVSLIVMCKDTDIDEDAPAAAEACILQWARDIQREDEFRTIEFDDQLDNPKQDAQGRLRWELELRGSQGRGKELKKWLKSKDFIHSEVQGLMNRVRFDHEGLVVIEGRVGVDMAGRTKNGVITVYEERSPLVDTLQQAIDCYNIDFDKLLIKSITASMDTSALDEALKLQVLTRFQSGVWIIGDKRQELSTWPRKKPFLVRAAELGSAEAVEHLVSFYKCDVNVRRIKEQTTALHMAAWHGYAHVVQALLKLGADTTLVNKYGETPLDSARKGREEYGEMKAKGTPDEFFPKTGKRPINVDLGLQMRFGNWDEVERLLSE